MYSGQKNPEDVYIHNCELFFPFINVKERK